ncbi:hypothetical protein C1C98_19440 [Pseudomonas ogarae]|uniref:Uncharacterized protein n=1 Tax=Pseudomonas ogarae (strain DSM 112162 / CECT 30235 / F113) TaxID=1114970 RepID=A0ABN5G835_PSEO1|nr:hypothetical protein C1C98_19440 [Pseudomonas ogarae]
MGASLLAMADYQPTMMLDLTPSSRASSLPHGLLGWMHALGTRYAKAPAVAHGALPKSDVVSEVDPVAVTATGKVRAIDIVAQLNP